MTTTYERPRIQSLNASQILEMMGPVQGYNGGDSPRVGLISPAGPGQVTRPGLGD